MKRLQQFFWGGLLACLPLSIWACSCAPSTTQEDYDDASAVALVNVSGDEVEVIRSWKTGLPKWIKVYMGGDSAFGCGYGSREKGIYLLYLYRSKDGTFATSACTGNAHESDRHHRNFLERIHWLENSGVEYNGQE